MDLSYPRQDNGIILPACSSVAVEVGLLVGATYAYAAIATPTIVFAFGVTLPASGSPMNGPGPALNIWNTGAISDGLDDTNIVSTSGNLVVGTEAVFRFEYDGFGLRIFRDGIQHTLPTPQAAMTPPLVGATAVVTSPVGNGSGQTLSYLTYLDIIGEDPPTTSAFWTEFVGSREVV